MPGSLEGQYIRLEVISGNNLKAPSWRFPAGIYISINIESRRRWKSATRSLSSEESVAWGDTVTLSSHASPALSVEIRASYEVDRMLGSGEVIGIIQMSWDEVLDHGDEAFELSFPPVHGTCPSLTLKAAVVHPCDDQDGGLFDSIVDCEIARDTDAARSLPAVYIHESAQLCCKLLPLCPQGTYFRSIGVDGAVDHVIGRCNNLAIDASDEGIHLRRVVLELCPLGHQRRPRALDKLSRALRIRFSQRGSIDDVDESIQFRREAISLCPEGHADRNQYLNNLASSLQSRFDHQGQYRDLNEVISTHEEVLRLRPVGHKSRDISLGHLGRALRTRFNHRGVIDDINRAISLHREQLTLRPSGHPRHDTTLANLALALKTRYEKLHVDEDLNEAIDLYRESLRLRRHDHPDTPCKSFQFELGALLSFHATRENEDIEEAIQLCQESLAALPSLHPHRYSATLVTCRLQWRTSDWQQDIPLKDFQNASLRHIIGRLRRNKWSWIARRLTQHFFELLDAHWQRDHRQLHATKLLAAFSGARTLPAVQLAEQGRGQQWSLASRLRTPLEELESTNLKLACSFSELSKRLSNAQGLAGSTDGAAADRAATEYRRRTMQWEAVVAEIRHLQGFSRFLLPPSYEDLQVAAHHGPVIILIASQYSCSAVIVPTSGEPHHVPLPSVTLTDLNNLKDHFTRAIRQASIMGLKEPRNDLIVLLRAVWDEIMLPIVNVLQHLKSKHQSRIWLCPTAAFTSIPLHAAHPFRTNADRSKEPCLEDLYICSYTPTLSALIRSRQMMKKHVPPSFVVIGQGQPGARGKELLAVDSELDLVRKLVPAAANRTTISGNAATRAGALEALEQNTWVHLACHGKQDHMQPYNSHFAMKDEPLTLLNIMDKDIPHAEFAFLSACHTAVGDKETPDEVIHLAAGLQFSGFKSVVGTLWEVDDAVAKHVVEAFYKNMFRDLKDGGIMDCTKAAWALNRATHAVKTKVPLEQRMVFIHIGV
ncbi:CHAT domain-containing protein [Suillus lakei]|nr:CHAT domain-containing protein [Suillus lakei]